jgi:two-component system, NarL family, sensor histidine kinase UhpB
MGVGSRHPWTYSASPIARAAGHAILKMSTKHGHEIDARDRSAGTGLSAALAAVRRQDRARRLRYAPLTHRVVAANAAILVAVAAVTMLIFSPGTVSLLLAFEELAILVAALVAMGLLNLALMRRALTPIERLTSFVRDVDPLRPGQRAPVPERESEAAELAVSFNDMLGRLEGERLESVRMALAAQESERLRVAQELHDEVGQSLTAVLLQLGRLDRSLPAEDRPVLADAQETARASLEEVRRIARSLRPEALDDLGLESALRVLAERMEEQSGMPIHTCLDAELPQLDDDEELVIYRIAQEALTNVVRHSGASRAELELASTDDGVQLVVRDDGAGLVEPGEGTGVRGMRERAALVGAELEMDGRRGRGVELRLDMPLERRKP